MNLFKNIFSKNKKNVIINSDIETFTKINQEQQIKQSQEDTQNFELDDLFKKSLNSSKTESGQASI